ncbi:MAG TPA: penicillin-binding transpeptidase domain-containing protein, partial [Capillimicrobium sp.]
ITQQFVKRALERENKRTVFEKLREAALAYHLTRKWSKEKILTEYLNSAYYGNGAYGIEAAARTYFGADHPECGTPEAPCAKELHPWESAFLAGVVQNPSGYDPIEHPEDARERRNLVLAKMLELGKITQVEYDQFIQQALPGDQQIQPPRQESPTPSTPYFTTWVRQQLVDRYGATRAFQGGLTVRTTLDLDFQQAAEAAVSSRFSNPDGPTASLVVIDNRNGEVRAMVGGRDYNETPFNLATQGQRQPGSSFKPFILAEALEQGISPDSTWPSAQREFNVPGTKGKEKFIVNNYEGSYAGVRTLRTATTYSDNAVYAAVGIEVGTKKVARMASKMGVRTPISTNLAMTLGGLEQGVTPLDMAHAYQTFARGGNLITGSLGAGEKGPVGIHEVKLGDKVIDENEVQAKRVLDESVAAEVTSILQTVVSGGTGTHAQLSDTWVAGKTGTTENYGDAWFVGYTERYTMAVWVGYPDKLTPMEYEYGGSPVAGGTYPAEIFQDVMGSIMAIDEQRAYERQQAKIAKLQEEGKEIPPELLTATTPSATSVAPTESAPTDTATGTDAPAPEETTEDSPPDAAAAPEPEAAEPAPEPAPDPAPAPEPTPAPAPAPAPVPEPDAGGAAAPTG